MSVAMRANAQAVAVLEKVGSNVNVTSSIIANIAKGVTVEAVVTGAVTGASAAGAWGVAYGVIGAVAIAAIPSIKEWMDRASIRPRADGTLEGPDPSACTIGPCYQYNIDEYVSTSKAGACGKYAAYIRTLDTTLANTSSSPYCDFTRDGALALRRGYGSVQVAPSPPTYAPVSPADAENRMALASPSAAEVQALVDAAFPPVVVPQSIAGPASVDGGNTVKLGTDGSKQEETCKFYLDYFPSNIKAHPECTTVTTIPDKVETKDVVTTAPDGTTSTQKITTTIPASSTTVTTTKDKVDQKDKTDCQAEPSRVGCATLDNVDQGSVPKETKNVSFTPEAITWGASASCPAPMTFAAPVTGQTIALSYDSFCDIAVRMKPFFLAGAGFIAMLIVMAGIKS